MYSLSAAKTETYEKGVDEGRRQILADIAKIVKDETDLHGDVDGQWEAIGEGVCEFLENEGYL